MSPADDPRALAARVLRAVAAQGRSLSTELPAARRALARPQDRRLLGELVHGTLRHWWRLRGRARRHLRQPLRERDQDIEALLMLGVYQLQEMRVPVHAAVSTTVAATRALGKAWASGLVNAVLRNIAREAGAPAGAEPPEIRWSYPVWLVQALRQAWPGHWEALLEAGNARAPMVLRVNTRRIGHEAYLAHLAAAELPARPLRGLAAALVLERPVDVERLPGFAEGWVSVQDAAAQLAAPLLDPQPGERILDACAAPGGKAAHLLELCPGLAGLVALELEPGRLARLRSTAERLGLDMQSVEGDVRTPEQWWDGRPFDAILLDAPCSATGVIRRHPDIKLLRRAADIPALAALQRAALEALWPLLRPGGRLLYATCSILPVENSERVADFLRAHPDAALRTLPLPWARETAAGSQILTGTRDMDGFFYACLLKR